MPALEPKVPQGFRLAEGARPETYTNTGWASTVVHDKTGIEMVFIPAGEFMMGSPSGETGRAPHEGPQHRVVLTKPFYLGKYEVTNAQYRRFRSSHDSKDYEGLTLNGDDQPVVYVSWNDGKAFCDWAGLRLPTEAEWEYACRAGTTQAYLWGDDPDGGAGWMNGWDQTAKRRWNGQTVFSWDDGYAVTSPVGRFKANAWGLYDMHGNVWEWCADWYDSTYYAKSPTNDPPGPSSGAFRVMRGGFWGSVPVYCRSAHRAILAPVIAVYGDGFRVARTIEHESEPKVPQGFRLAEGAGFETYTNTGWASAVVHEKTGTEMVFIPAGDFQMGSNEPNENPIHFVSISKPFYLGKYEVTQGEWQRVMGTNPSEFKGDRNPVDSVSWDECQAFLRKVADGLRLPTEAEWEYACRAGTTTRFSFGDSDGQLGENAWHMDNSGDQTHPVGQKRPNAWGLYDMHGNLFEWCGDWYGEYPSGSVTDPQGPSSGSYRVLRGGSWTFNPQECRSARRASFYPFNRASYFGFRVARGL